MSKPLASELAPRVCTKSYGALIVRNHPVEIEPVRRQLDARLSAKEKHFLPRCRVVGDFEHVLVFLLSVRCKGPKKVAAD